METFEAPLFSESSINSSLTSSLNYAFLYKSMAVLTSPKSSFFVRYVQVQSVYVFTNVQSSVLLPSSEGKGEGRGADIIDFGCVVSSPVMSGPGGRGLSMDHAKFYHTPRLPQLYPNSPPHLKKKIMSQLALRRLLSSFVIRWLFNFFFSNNRYEDVSDVRSVLDKVET